MKNLTRHDTAYSTRYATAHRSACRRTAIFYTCRISTKLEFPQKMFEKSPNIKLHNNLSTRSQYFFACGRSDGRTDRHQEVNSYFSQLCELAKLQSRQFDPVLTGPSDVLKTHLNRIAVWNPCVPWLQSKSCLPTARLDVASHHIHITKHVQMNDVQYQVSQAYKI